VDGGGWGDQREREILAGFSLGLPSSSSMPTANDKQTGFSELLDIQREIPIRSPSLSLVGLQERNRKEGIQQD
jgi:hypothetical protein